MWLFQLCGNANRRENEKVEGKQINCPASDDGEVKIRSWHRKLKNCTCQRLQSSRFLKQENNPQSQVKRQRRIFVDGNKTRVVFWEKQGRMVKCVEDLTKLVKKARIFPSFSQTKNVRNSYTF